ncbi:MAG: hypothetical protein ACO3Y3_09025, partial [Phycisphaerales bacterium]
AATKGLNEPRYAALPGIRKAKRKPKTKKSAADVGVTEADLELPAEPKGPVGGASVPLAPTPRCEPDEDRSAAKPPAEPPPPPSPARPRRALDDVRSLDEIDPSELDRFDMGEWIDGDR